MAMETKRFQTEAQIMFTDPSTMHPSLRVWILKKQREILVKEGIEPPPTDDQPHNSQDTSTGGEPSM